MRQRAGHEGVEAQRAARGRHPERTAATRSSRLGSQAMHLTTSIEPMRSLMSFVLSSVLCSDRLKSFWDLPIRRLLAGVDMRSTARPARLATPSCWYSMTCSSGARG